MPPRVSSASSSESPSFRVADRDPPLVTVPELRRELIGEMRRVNDEIPDSGPDERVYLPVDHPLSMEPEKRLRSGVGERAHALPRPAPRIRARTLCISRSILRICSVLRVCR